MKRKYTISLLLIAIMLAATITVGTSYSYWTVSRVQTGNNKVLAGCLNITINDLDINGNSTSINLDNTYPISDNDGLLNKPYELTIKNTCSIKAHYSVLLSALDDSTLEENHIKYHFIEKSPNTTTMVPSILGNLTPLELSDDFITELEENTNGNIKAIYKIGEGTLNPVNNNIEDEVTYNLRLWIDESADNQIMGTTFKSAVVVYAEATR